MNKISNDALGKIVEFLGKDSLQLSETCKLYYKEVRKARYDMLTRGYFEASLEEYHGLVHFYSLSAALAAMELEKKDENVLWIGIRSVGSSTCFTEWYK
jgi:hypothetical protein